MPPIYGFFSNVATSKPAEQEKWYQPVSLNQVQASDMTAQTFFKQVLRGDQPQDAGANDAY